MTELAEKCEKCGWRRGSPMCKDYPTDTVAVGLRVPMRSRRRDSWEKRCKRCGEELTNAESIARGYGPTCWEKVSGAALVIEGDPLPSVLGSGADGAPGAEGLPGLPTAPSQ